MNPVFISNMSCCLSMSANINRNEGECNSLVLIQINFEILYWKVIRDKKRIIICNLASSCYQDRCMICFDVGSFSAAVGKNNLFVYEWDFPLQWLDFDWFFTFANGGDHANTIDSRLIRSESLVAARCSLLFTWWFWREKLFVIPIYRKVGCSWIRELHLKHKQNVPHNSHYLVHENKSFEGRDKHNQFIGGNGTDLHNWKTKYAVEECGKCIWVSSFCSLADGLNTSFFTLFTKIQHLWGRFRKDLAGFTTFGRTYAVQAL